MYVCMCLAALVRQCSNNNTSRLISCARGRTVVEGDVLSSLTISNNSTITAVSH